MSKDKLYKYRSGSTRDIEALMNNQFYASSIEKLNDIHEGKIVIDNQEIKQFPRAHPKRVPCAEKGALYGRNVFLSTWGGMLCETRWLQFAAAER